MNILNVIFVNTNNVSIENLLSSSFLSDNDLLLIDKYKIEEAKKEKAYSQIFKNRFVGSYQINEHGKPISDHCYFNISHCKGVVVFIKDVVPIGIDIEKIKPVDKALIDYISSKEEKEYIKNEVNFYEIWTNKESLTKCIGTGIKERIKEIPGIPINGLKEYKNKKYFSKTIKFKDYIISITRESDEPFDINIKEEIL